MGVFQVDIVKVAWLISLTLLKSLTSRMQQVPCHRRKTSEDRSKVYTSVTVGNHETYVSVRLRERPTLKRTSGTEWTMLRIVEKVGSCIGIYERTTYTAGNQREVVITRSVITFSFGQDDVLPVFYQACVRNHHLSTGIDRLCPVVQLSDSG